MGLLSLKKVQKPHWWDRAEVMGRMGWDNTVLSMKQPLYLSVIPKPLHHSTECNCKALGFVNSEFLPALIECGFSRTAYGVFFL